MHRKRIALSANSTWNLANFREGIIAALVDAGFDVVTLAPEDDGNSRISVLGGRTVAVPMDAASTSPAHDAALLIRYVRALRSERPDVLLGFTAKPNIYGSAAAHMLGIPVINNISGLGSGFMHGGWLSATMRALYRASLKRSHRVFFQNPDDLELFLAQRLVVPERAGLLPGSGVNLQRFAMAEAQRPHGSTDDAFCFLVVGRLLRDKGIVEFVRAARNLRACHPHVRFQLLGAVDSRNPSAIPKPDVDSWVREGLVEYLGTTDDVRPFVAAADCVVLPSYREGTPRTLLEAAAMARPLIATDVPGCREVVEDGVNGFLCQARDARSLGGAMSRMLALAPEQRAAMGAAGRARMERDFDERIVIDRYLHAISEAIRMRAS